MNLIPCMNAHTLIYPSFIYIYIYIYIYAPQWGLITLAKEFTAAHIMQSSSNELSTQIGYKM